VERGAETEWRITEMTAVDAEGAMLRTVVRGGEGLAGEPKQSRLTWEELRAHAIFPRAATTIVDETIQTAAGKFACKRYTVVGDEETTTFWFATELPGAPVKMTVERGGVVVETRTLMKHRIVGS
jgi:hypothetical protein